uniref:Purple acid phosphatase n=1 Tax=Brassica napus TaxID=3708 RepID=B4XB43_BRANA|nr:purple acid phosphatase 12 protein family isoform 6 [Brassica napus]ABV89756.1 purple acid phosphatase 12 protein family isoform 6 [Brassica napus]
MSSRSDLTIMRVCFIIFLLGVLVELCDGGITSGYVRSRGGRRLDPPLGLLRGSDLPDDMPLDSDVFLPDDRPLHSDVFLPDKKKKDSYVFVPDDMPLDSDVFKVPPGPNTPQQVHITQGNHEGNGVIISWVTPSAPCSNTVRYWSENGKSKKLAVATINTYRFFNYTSGYIHHCLIDDLEFDMKYYYEIGSRKWQRRFWFFTPPKPGPDVPYTFGLIGDLGQTYDSNRTLSHYEMNPGKGQAVLFLGDLSYADLYPLHDNNRWDTWGRFVERSVAYQPWIWTAGNHEIDYAPEIGETEPFKPFTNRYHTPYKASGSISPLWYSIKRASAYIIVMSCYSSYGVYTPQYKWLRKEFQRVNRKETPWLIVLVHCPFYHSYERHYMEGETMRVMYEPWFVKSKVDVVFAGHVHAYERSERVSNIAYNIVNGLCEPISDESAPVYITIGDGGNAEGLLTEMMEPQPSYSAFREASFGHGLLDIKNRTHAYFSWNRNEDGSSEEADSVWLLNRYWGAPKNISLGFGCHPNTN